MAAGLVYSFERPVSAAAYRALAEQTDWASGRGVADIARALQACFAVLGVWDGARLVGVARVLSDGVFNAQVLDVVVDAEYRGRGIGSEMMRRILDGCRDIEVVSLNCGPSEVPFYQRLGFQEGCRMARQGAPERLSNERA